MTNAHEVVAGYWAAAEARDWNAFGALLADDVLYRGPQTREQVRGRDAYIRFNVEGFPYDWHVTVERIVGEDRYAASWIELTGPDGTQPGLCFFEVGEDGRIAQITDFWPDPYELPASWSSAISPRPLPASTVSAAGCATPCHVVVRWPSWLTITRCGWLPACGSD